MSIAEMLYDIDVAMNIIENVGPELYFDMIGGEENAQWLHGMDMDAYDFLMSDGEDSDDEYDITDKKTFLTLQDSHVIQHLSFHEDRPGFRLPKTSIDREECYEDLYRLLEEVELMVRTWRKRCSHPYTAHLRTDPQVDNDFDSDHLRRGEDYGFSDYEMDEEDEVPVRIPVVPNENLTKKKFCQSVKFYLRVFAHDGQFEMFQRLIIRIKKYVFKTVFQAFMATIPVETASKLPQELWEKIWKHTQNGYFRFKGSRPLEEDDTYYKAGQRVNKSTQPYLYKIEQNRISELFGAVGNLHITLFEVLFQSSPSKFSGLVDEWEVDGLSCESSSCKTLWALHCALLQQKFARLRHLDTHLTAVESGEEVRVELTPFQKIERGLFAIENLTAEKYHEQIDNTIKQSGNEFYSGEQCRFFGFIGYEPLVGASASEEHSLNLRLYDAVTGRIRYRVVTNLTYSLFKLELAKFAPRRIGRTNWRRSLCLTNQRLTVIYCDTAVTSLQLKVWSTPLDAEATAGDQQVVIQLEAPLLDQTVAENENSENTSTAAKKKKGNQDTKAKLTRELSKKELKPTVFHSSDRIVVCLLNPYKTRETILMVFNAGSGEKYLHLTYPDMEMSLIGFKDNLALMINRTSSHILLLSTECGETVLDLAISDLNKDASSYGPWVGLFDCVPGTPEIVLLRSDNSEYRIYKYDPKVEMSVPVLKESGPVYDKSLLPRDVLNCASFRDGVLYFNKRTPATTAEPLYMQERNECYHEVGCYHFNKQNYMPLTLMTSQPMMMTKYNEQSNTHTDSMVPAKGFETRRPLFIIDTLRLGQLNDSYAPTLKIFDMNHDESSLINFEIQQMKEVEEEVRRKQALREQQERDKEAMQQQLRTQMEQDRTDARQNIVDKKIRVKGYIIEWRNTYGFIRSEGVARSLGRIFFHRSNMMPHKFGWNSNIEVGMQLEYTISTGRDPGSFQAYDVAAKSGGKDLVPRHSHGQMPDLGDIQIVSQTARVSHDIAQNALKNTNFDIIAAISNLVTPPAQFY